MGLTFPGCPATYQQQSQQFLFQGESQSQKFIDEHQKIHQFRQGDIVVLPTGVAHWFYNDGDTPVVALYVYDINNSANQLEPRHRVTTFLNKYIFIETMIVLCFSTTFHISIIH
jgi:hypothetical protein